MRGFLLINNIIQIPEMSFDFTPRQNRLKISLLLELAKMIDKKRKKMMQFLLLIFFFFTLNYFLAERKESLYGFFIST